ncbi:alpha/beta-hydrolase [Aspergillus californicus]
MAEFQHISLSTKPTAQLSYTFQGPATTTTKPALIVFLNGLGLPQAGWFPVITKLTEKYTTSNLALPGILTYDRYGQGQTTDRDPDDPTTEDPTHGHDCLTVIQDLHQLLTQITAEKLAVPKLEDISLIFVANSIGCALARIYAQTYPGTVAGLLLLDSVLANSDFVSVFPDPDSADFNPESLPTGVPVEVLRAARAGTRRVFHPSVGSKEGLSRRNLAELLPSSDGPQLLGPDGKGPYVTVVGHDFEAFAVESSKMGMPLELTRAYTNPYWQKYNEGLVKITEEARTKGPLLAPGSGHFVQKDNPEFVVEELGEILGKVLGL